MAFTYDIDEVPAADLPSVEYDVRQAKMFLQKHSPESGDSLYDHLTEILNKILNERPSNAVDIFEDYSRKLKEERYKSKTDVLRDLYVPPVQYEEAKKLIELFKMIPISDEEGMDEIDLDEDNKEELKRPNMMEFLFYFEQVDVGLPRSELVLLNLSIRKLMDTKPIENVRFWGKVLGNPKNYYVVEAELQAEELGRRLEELETLEQLKLEKDAAESKVIDNTTVDENLEKLENDPMKVNTTDASLTTEPEEEPNFENQGLILKLPEMPKSLWKLPPEVPAEQIGTGINKKVYFVCNSPGLDEWVELPSATPQQIVVSRQIVRYCTGNLETPIFTFPPFPGTEKNYLRAQIARIGAATLVSPIGYFTFGGGEDEEEEMMGEEQEEELGAKISVNSHYDPLPIKDLIDPSMANWCHHAQYILKQGRMTWWNPAKPEIEDEEALEEEEEEEAEEDQDKLTPDKEQGPPLLTPLSEDAFLESIPPWTVRESSRIQPDIAVAIVRSNIWPGAYTFATGKKFANVYIGWGHKYTAYNYTPPTMPPVEDQYKIGPEVMEIADPTFEEEEAYRIAHMPVPKVSSIGGEEEESEEEDDDDEDDEDDEDD